MIKVLLVDDHAAVRQGLRMWLGLQPNLSIVGEAGNGRTALVLVRELRPDVVLMDVEMPGMDGVAATSLLLAENQQTAVIILSAYTDSQIRTRALAAGAVAVVDKHSGSDDLLRAIYQAIVGHEPIQ